MSKIQVLITAATAFELAAVMKILETKFKKVNFFEFSIGELSIFPMVTGVGMPTTAYALGKYDRMHEMSFVMQIGLAGAFNRSLELGQIVEVEVENFGDLGVEEADGTFTDIFELGLTEPNRYPFTANKIVNDDPPLDSELTKVNALSLNKVHGTESSIMRTYSKYPADIETMEGAAFFYACKMQHVRFIQIRAISNYVEKRQREHWAIDLALENLGKYMESVLGRLQDPHKF